MSINRDALNCRSFVDVTTLAYSAVSYPMLFIAVMTLFGCAKNAPQTETPAPTPVRIATADLGPSAPRILAAAVIANKDELQLSFKTDGVIRKIHVGAGTAVKRGQKLAELEPVEVDAQVTQARQMADKAEREWRRGERLHTDQVIALEQLEALRTQHEVAKAQLQAAQFNHRFAVIAAPDDGSVLRKLAEDHQVVAAGQPILVVGAQHRGYVARAALADREIVQLKLGDAVQVQLDAFPGQTFAGEVSEISTAASTQNGLFQIEVSLRDTPPLVGGLVARLSITPASAGRQQLVYAPIAAILEGHQRKAAVFVLDGEHARRREVTVAFIDNDRVALQSGLQAGERVITDGALYLDDGERVSVEPAHST